MESDESDRCFICDVFLCQKVDKTHKKLKSYEFCLQSLQIYNKKIWVLKISDFMTQNNLMSKCCNSTKYESLFKERF